MSTYTYPHTIENGAGGERLTFLRRVPGTTGDRLEVENVVKPGAGPIMHVHHYQEEALTVVQGRIGYQRLGEPARFAGPGETVTFRAGEAHKFWNAGEEDLRGTGYIEPADNVEHFLGAIFESQRRSGRSRPNSSTRRSWRGATEASSGWRRYRHPCSGSCSPSWWRSAGCSAGTGSTPTRSSPSAAERSTGGEPPYSPECVEGAFSEVERLVR